MEIREPADRGELGAALEARNRALRVGHRSFASDALIDEELAIVEETYLAELYGRVQLDGQQILVADVDDAVVGYVYLDWEADAEFVEDGDAYLQGLYVDPAHWREGVGSSLLGAANQTVPPAVEGLVVDVLAENERAREFLESQRFEQPDDYLTVVGDEQVKYVVYRREL